MALESSTAQHDQAVQGLNSAECFVLSASGEPVLNVKGSACLGEPRLPFRSGTVLSCVALLLPRRASTTFPLWSRE